MRMCQQLIPTPPRRQRFRSPTPHLHPGASERVHEPTVNCRIAVCDGAVHSCLGITPCSLFLNRLIWHLPFTSEMVAYGVAPHYKD